MNYVAIDGDGEEKIANCELIAIFDIWKGKKLIHPHTDEYTPIKTWVPKYCSNQNQIFILMPGSVEKLIGRKWLEDDQPIFLGEENGTMG